MNDATRLELYRQTFMRQGHLTLGRKQIEWLFDLAEIGIEAKGRILLDTDGMPDCVVLAHASPPAQRRRRKLGGMAP
jgi:hypothetical protein